MCKHFKVGMSTRRVCDLSMVSEIVFFHWVTLGKAEERTGKKHGEFREFREVSVVSGDDEAG